MCFWCHEHFCDALSSGGLLVMHSRVLGGLLELEGRAHDSAPRYRRAREILTWVAKHRPAAWVALDDWPLFLEKEPGLDGHFVQTRARRAWTRGCARWPFGVRNRRLDF